MLRTGLTGKTWCGADCPKSRSAPELGGGSRVAVLKTDRMLRFVIPVKTRVEVHHFGVKYCETSRF